MKLLAEFGLGVLLALVLIVLIASFTSKIENSEEAQKCEALQGKLVKTNTGFACVKELKPAKE